MAIVKKAYQFLMCKFQLLLDELKPQSHWILRTCLTSIFIYLGWTKYNNIEMFY